MSRKQKLIVKLQSNVSDFTFHDAELLLHYFNYHISNKGKTSGSRVMFVNDKNNSKILLHRPHPGNELREYQVKQLIEFLKQEGLL